MNDFLRAGRMLGSKSAYCSNFPDHVVVFNANIVSKSKGKIWWGDLDINADADKLKALARAEGEELYVLHEMDGRFENEAAPKIGKSVARIAPDGSITLER